jgi:hypothetical protein
MGALHFPHIRTVRPSTAEPEPRVKGKVVWISIYGAPEGRHSCSPGCEPRGWKPSIFPTFERSAHQPPNRSPGSRAKWFGSPLTEPRRGGIHVARGANPGGWKPSIFPTFERSAHQPPNRSPGSRAKWFGSPLTEPRRGGIHVARGANPGGWKPPPFPTFQAPAGAAGAGPGGVSPGPVEADRAGVALPVVPGWRPGPGTCRPCRGLENRGE